MTSKKLTVQEKALAYQLWEMSSDVACSHAEMLRAFKEAPQKVCDAVDSATQQSHYQHGVCKNPFGH